MGYYDYDVEGFDEDDEDDIELEFLNEPILETEDQKNTIKGGLKQMSSGSHTAMSIPEPSLLTLTEEELVELDEEILND